MPSYVVVTNSAGDPYGAGPIHRATRWTAVNRLDKAGRCSFELPAADPRAREVLANKREAHYYTLRGGTPTEVGALIIDKIETVVAGREEPMLRVEGDNLLAELATRTVGALELYDVEAHTAHSVAHTYLYEGEYRTADMPAAYDGNAGTSYALDTGLKAGDYLYVCGESKVSCVWVAFGAGANGVQATMGAQYYDGYDWLDCQNIQDTTSSAGRTFAQNGGIRFTRPADQVQTTHNGVEGYWIRLTPSVDLSDGIIIAEMSVDEDVPTGTGLADIMAYAPPGWSVSGGYATTKSTAYMQFASESVLEALVALAEHTGEHFRLGVGKRIEWLRDDPEVAPVDSGVYALAAPATAANACTILELSESKDSYELATRVYPYGGRQGNGRVSLATCTETPPAGYTLSTTDNYIKADVAENTYGRIDTTREWPDVGQQDEDDYHAVLAANALYAVALEWLERHSQVQRAYTLRVAHLERQVRPGETVRVTYQRARDGERYVDIDGALVVLGVTLEESGDGIRTAALELATTDTWPLSGTDFLLREIRGSRRGRAGDVSTTTTTQTIVSAQVNIDGGTIDGTAIGSNVPASGVFSTVAVKGVAALQGGAAVTGNIAVTGTVDGVDVSAHAANPDAHHAPVTVSNQGLSLSGQALGLKLAANPGLDLSAGLGLGTPGTLTAATANTVTAESHAHAVTTGAPGAVRPGDTAEAGSGAALARADHRHAVSAGTPVAVSLAANAEGAATAFARADHQHHLDEAITPTWTGAHQFQATVTARSILPEATDTYDLGSALRWWREQYVSQINAAVFAEATAQLLGGWFIVGHDQGSLGAAVGPTDTAVDFGDPMAPGDMVVIRSHDAGGAVKAEYLQVGALVSGTTYNVTRDLAGAHATDPAWPAGTPYLVLGQAGAGRVELNAYDTPRISLIRQGAAYNAQAEVVRIGDLNGGWGYGAETYGVALGEYAAGKVNVTVDPTSGLRMRLYSKTLGQWAPDGTITVGEVAAGQGNVRLSSAGVQLRTNETALISLDTGGNAAFGQVATGQGNAYWNASNKRLEFRGGTNGTVVNAYIDTDGAFVAADGKLAMYDDSFRATVGNDAFVSNRFSFRWGSFAGAEVGFIGDRSFDGANNQISIAAKGVSGGAWGTIALRARLSTEDLQTDSDGTTLLVQPTNAFLYNHGLIVAKNATNVATTVAAGDARIEGGLNVGSATGALAGEVRGTGSADVLEWALTNSKDTDPALVVISAKDSQPASVAIGRRDPNDATYTGYGAAGDGFLYNSGAGRALNIIVSDATNGALRVYVGSNAKGNARLTIDKNGVATFHKALGCGISYAPGDGNIDAAGYVRGQKGLIVGEGQSAPTAASGIAFIWVDSNGNLKITFGDGTTKTIISKA